MNAPLSPNENQRLAALRELNILDTPAEERFDRITRLAQRTFNVPMTMISLVDDHRQWFKSRQGIAISETPRDISFCTHAIEQSGTMVVSDAILDSRFVNNPLVTGDPGIRFYAGCPLEARDGSRVGTLCLIDRQPRQLTENELHILEELGTMAEDELNAVSALYQSEQRFQAIFEKSPVGVDVIDVQTSRFVRVNDAICQMLGYSREELLALSLPDVIPIEDLKANEGLVLSLIKGERKYFQIEVHHRHKSGKSIWARVYVSLLRNSQGAPQYFIAVAEDLTELKLAESALIQSEKMAGIGQFCAGIAHDLNNPIAVMLGFLESLLARKETADPMAFPLKSIDREARRCQTLVQNLLAFSRGEGNKAVIKPENLKHVLDGALALVATLARSKQVELICPPCPEIPWVDANSGQIQQVIINLCTNAIDAMPNGGKLTVGLARQGENVEIFVQDTGTGITPEVKARMFETFFTTKELGKGTGLGLSLISGIVKKHHGRIDVQTQVGQGTTFTVILPVSQSAVSLPEKKAA